MLDAITFLQSRAKREKNRRWYAALTANEQLVISRSVDFKEIDLVINLEMAKKFVAEGSIILDLRLVMATRYPIDNTVNYEQCVPLDLVSDLISQQEIVAEKFFISYRRKDQPDMVGRFRDTLCSKLGEQCCFMDVYSLHLGIDFRREIKDLISKSDLFLVMIGPEWLDQRDDFGNRRIDNFDDPVLVEIETAFAMSIRIIPVLLRGAVMPSETQLPCSISQLSYLTAAKLRSDPDFSEDVNSLLRKLSVKSL